MTDARCTKDSADLPSGDGPWPAAVVRHEGAPGGDHFDVLLAERIPAGPDDECCACWRSPADPGSAAAGSLLAVTRIHAHRALYLGLTVPRTLGGGRGTVFPVRTGTWHRVAADRVLCRWSGGSATELSAVAPGTWRIA